MTRPANPRRAPGTSLTPAERTLLLLLANGRRLPQLTKELGLARNTLASYRSTIFHKLNVDNVPDAVDAALATGDLHPSEIHIPSRGMLRQRAQAAEARIAAVRAQCERWRHTPDRKRAAEEMLRALDDYQPAN